MYRLQTDLSPVQVSSNTYVLQMLDDKLTSIFIVGRHGMAVQRGLFDTAFNKLTKAPNVIGDFLGSIARIYRGLVTGESDVGKIFDKMYIMLHYQSAS